MSLIQPEDEIEVLDELKRFVKGELKNLSTGLKDLKQEFRTLNFKLYKIEGKLEGLEKKLSKHTLNLERLSKGLIQMKREEELLRKL